MLRSAALNKGYFNEAIVLWDFLQHIPNAMLTHLATALGIDGYQSEDAAISIYHMTVIWSAWGGDAECNFATYALAAVMAISAAYAEIDTQTALMLIPI